MASTSSPRDPGEVEWGKAQEMHISVNLIAAAKRQLRFLALVHSTPLLKIPEVLRHAVERYLNCWLPLLSACEDDVQLVPPLDCAWIWHCHKLNPVQYEKDCIELFGKLLDMGPHDDWDQEPDDCVEQATTNRWRDSFPSEPYSFVVQAAVEFEDGGIRAMNRPISSGSSSTSSGRRVLSFDLVAASERQSSFYYQVCRPWMSDEKYLQIALERYKGFLYLIARSLHKIRMGNSVEDPPSPTSTAIPFFVPTYDIDLLWHSHQLCPTAYQADTIQCIGKRLDHDDSDSDRGAGQRLHTGFLETCDQWRATFGRVYELAGAMYRGPAANPMPPSPFEYQNQVVTGYPVTPRWEPPAPMVEGDMSEDNLELSKRETMQVHLVLLGAKYLPKKPWRKNDYYVRVTTLRKCPGLNLTTALMDDSETSDTSEVTWNQAFSFEVEISTTGLKLELMRYTVSQDEDSETNGSFMERIRRRIQRKFPSRGKCIGEVVVNWMTDLLDSSVGLSFTKWSPVAAKWEGERPDLILGVLPCPELHFSVSVTPPTIAPYIFRILEAPITDDYGIQVAREPPYPEEKLQEGRWVTRAVADHQGHEQFVIRKRFARGEQTLAENPRRISGDQRVIQVHRGALSRKREWHYHGQFLVRTPGTVVGIARQLPLAIEHGESGFHQHWSLLNDAAILTINRPTMDLSSWVPDCHIQGNFGSPFRLVSGRRLGYEVRGGGSDSELTTSNEEDNFLTLVRYTPDSPFGKATALINWQSGCMEVVPEESVVLVLLIASAISSSLVDMKHPSLKKASPFHGQSIRRQSRIARGYRNPDSDGDLVLIQRTVLSDVSDTPATTLDHFWEKSRDNKLFFTPWWRLTDAQITQSRQFGGTQCGSGACGGGACGGGGCINRRRS